VDLIDDPVSRRNFMKIMSASFVLAGLGVSGCRRPEHRILPFSKMPENYVHGTPQYFATSMPSRGTAIPLVAKSYDGRPIKVEGNAEFPDSNGGTDQYTQASILSLYDPDRGLNFKLAKKDDKGGKSLKVIAKAKVLEQFDGLANGRTHVLMEQSSSPSRARLVAGLKAKGVNFYEYEPIDFSVHEKAAGIAFGPGVKPRYKLGEAKAILSLDCDFLGTEESAFQHIREFADGRRVKDDHKENPAESMNRLYSVEGLLTLTGTNADHRLRIPTGSVGRVAALALAETLDSVGLPGAEDAVSQLRALAGNLSKDFSNSHATDGKAKADTAKWVRQCVADLLRLAKRGDKTLVVAGYRQPKEVHLAAMAMNSLLGNVGSTLLLQKAKPSGNGSIADLAKRLAKGDNLVILGGDPAYNAPADLDWAKLAGRAGRVVRHGYYIDQTAQDADAYIPAAHYLESWGDARTSDGTLVPVQPLIAPLFGGMTGLEVLARIGGTESDPYKIVRKTFDGIAGSGDSRWEKFLHDGFLADSASGVESREFDWDAASVALDAGAKPVKLPGKGNYEVTFYRDHSMDDGRWCNNGWLLETPNPVTRIAWDNVLLMSYQTARELLGEEVAKEALDFEELDRKFGGLPGRFGFHSDAGRFYQKVYKLEVNGKELEGPIWLLPGMADNVVGVALGYGRGLGRVGGVAGFNAYRARTSSEAHFAGGAELTEKPSATYEVACTQEQGIMDGRPVIREGNADDFNDHKDFVKHFDLDSIHHTTHITKKGARYSWEEDQTEDLAASPYKKPFGGESNGPGKMDEERQQWGMVIDLGTCVGCDACVVACQSENNIPIVGKEQLAKGREMSWIRIDRYFSGDEHNPQVNYQAVACQHCEDAPCESVCPVNATVHDEEGLNLMAYNRCIGTRYCSNNCPYKVRRFNYFDYNRRPLDRLYETPLNPGNKSSNGEWELVRWYNDPSRGSVPGLDDGEGDVDWDLIKLSKNPDVSVRMRGVMEKCSYCVQRIQRGKIEQKVEARDSDNVKVPDGKIKTACEQACPAEAITFGDISDEGSRVYRLKRQNRNYSLLGFLDTRPRTTYLAKLRNPNVNMPDYYDIPNSVTEYNEKNHGNVFGGATHHEAKGHEKEAKH
jgi:molybdopterin-containing oxidoreductase family iron-sulfur binding subunit